MERWKQPLLRIRKALEESGLGYDKSAANTRGSVTTNENARLGAEALTMARRATSEEAHDTIVRYFSHIFSNNNDPHNIQSTSLVPLFVYLTKIKRDGANLEVANHGQMMSALEIMSIASCQKAWKRSHLHIGEYYSSSV